MWYITLGILLYLSHFVLTTFKPINRLYAHTYIHIYATICMQLQLLMFTLSQFATNSLALWLSGC